MFRMWDGRAWQKGPVNPAPKALLHHQTLLHARRHLERRRHCTHPVVGASAGAPLDLQQAHSQAGTAGLLAGAAQRQCSQGAGSCSSAVAPQILVCMHTRRAATRPPTSRPQTHREMTARRLRATARGGGAPAQAGRRRKQGAAPPPHYACSCSVGLALNSNMRNWSELKAGSPAGGGGAGRRAVGQRQVCVACVCCACTAGAQPRCGAAPGQAVPVCLQQGRPGSGLPGAGGRVGILSRSIHQLSPPAPSPAPTATQTRLSSWPGSGHNGRCGSGGHDQPRCMMPAPNQQQRQLTDIKN